MAAGASHCHKVLARFAFDMLPSDADCALGFVRARLSDALLRYSPDIMGVILSYSNEKLLSTRAFVHDYFPLLRVHAEAECLVFRPVAGSKMVGSVTSVGQDHIALLVLGAFNAVIPLSAVPSKIRPSPQKVGLWEHKKHADYRIEQGTPLVFTVQRCEDHFGLFGISGSLLEPGTGPYWRLVRKGKISIGKEAEKHTGKKKKTPSKEKDALRDRKRKKRKEREREAGGAGGGDWTPLQPSIVGSTSRGTAPIAVRGSPCPWGPGPPGEQNGWSRSEGKVKVEQEDIPTGVPGQALAFSGHPLSRSLNTSVDVKTEAPEVANGISSHGTGNPQGKRYKKQHKETDVQKESGSKTPELAGFELKLEDLLDKVARPQEAGDDKTIKKKEKKRSKMDGRVKDGAKASSNGAPKVATIETGKSGGLAEKLKKKERKKKKRHKEGGTEA